MKNAIQQRIDRLTDIWNRFAENPEAVLLRWVVDDDTARILDAFIELQNEEESGTPDLFIRFNEPFEDLAEYGFTLRDSLIAKYEEIRQTIAADNIPAEWFAPSVEENQSNIDALTEICSSMRSYYKDWMRRLVIVLTPASVSDPVAWRVWLSTLLQAELAAGVRIMVLDDATKPALSQLATSQPKLVMTVQPGLDMSAAYSELVNAIPGTGPGFLFRRFFVALTNAAVVGNVAAAGLAAQRALVITQEQGWTQLATATHMALGAAYFAKGDYSTTLKCYRDANQAIVGSDEPTASKLKIQTRLAEAAALIADGKHREAAEVYEATAPLAEQHREALSAMDSWRMAAWCREVTGEHQQAWQLAEKALTAGESLDEATRSNSTFPYVGQSLVRLADRGINKDRKNEVLHRMEELLGPDWQQALPGSAAS